MFKTSETSRSVVEDGPAGEGCVGVGVCVCVCVCVSARARARVCVCVRAHARAGCGGAKEDHHLETFIQDSS